MQRIPHQLARSRGYSLSEMIFVIALIGILASIALPIFGDILGKGKATAAKERAEWLNAGLQTYIQVYGDFFQSPSGSAADETIVMRTIQWGDPSKPARPGLPYIPLTYNPVASSDPNTYRLQWTGSAYRVLEKGQGGTGLLVPFDGSDFTAAQLPPPTFRPAGR